MNEPPFLPTEVTYTVAILPPSFFFHDDCEQFAAAAFASDQVRTLVGFCCRRGPHCLQPTTLGLAQPGALQPTMVKPFDARGDSSDPCLDTIISSSLLFETLL